MYIQILILTHNHTTPKLTQFLPHILTHNHTTPTHTIPTSYTHTTPKLTQFLPHILTHTHTLTNRFVTR